MNIIVTGASRGIGFELSRIFAAVGGHSVLAISRDTRRLGELEDTCRRENPESSIRTLAFDISDNERVETALPALVEESFTTLDVLVNNAGLLIKKPIMEMAVEDAREMMEVNFLSPMIIIRALIGMLQKGRDPHVVNIGSMAGVQGKKKFPGLSAYSASKGALHILTECLAEEFTATGIRFNALALGSVQTEMLSMAFPGLKAPLRPEEMAEYIAGFALRGQKVYNGVTLPVALSTP